MCMQTFLPIMLRHTDSSDKAQLCISGLISIINACLDEGTLVFTRKLSMMKVCGLQRCYNYLTLVWEQEGLQLGSRDGA